MSYYEPKYFKLFEILPKAFYEKHNKRGDQLWGLFDSRVLWTMDQLRERYGKAIMNTWHWGGSNEYRGYRPPGCRIGAQFSQHRFGRAADMVFEEVTSEEVREDIINNKFSQYTGLEVFKYIKCIETDVGWLHFDVRAWEGSLLIVKP